MNFRENLKLVFSMRCDQADRLTSDAFERALTRSEKLGLVCHRFVCHSCRQFRNHLHFLRHACRALQLRERTQTDLAVSLDPQAKQRLKQFLAEHQQRPH